MWEIDKCVIILGGSDVMERIRVGVFKYEGSICSVSIGRGFSVCSLIGLKDRCVLILFGVFFIIYRK